MNDNKYADLTSHDTFAAGFPFATFARMRDEDPCAWVKETDGGHGFWAITRYDDIKELNAQPEIFSSAQGIRLEEQTPEEFEARKTFQETDPPIHTRQRMLLHRAFSRKMIAKYEDLVRELANDVVTTAVVNKELDVVKQIARKLPMRMLGRVLGTPDEDGEWLVDRGDALIANSDPEFTSHVIDKVNTDEYRFMPFRSPAGKDIYDYAKQQMVQRLHTKMDDILGLLLEPNKDGEVLSELEFKNFFALAVAAGNDTTRYSLAFSMYHLANNQSLFSDLKGTPDDDPLWDTAVEEFIRFASPTLHFRRTAVQDYELHGKSIKKGDKVVFWFSSGNFDERQFDQPIDIDIRRSPNQHMAFGQGGPHACLGMWLARLEVKVTLQELLKQVDSMSQIEPEAYLRSNFIRGIKHLKLRITTVA
jgi:hypothetical protein